MSNGYVSSRVNLRFLAGEKDVRFRISTDDEKEAVSWFVDDVRVYTCGKKRGR